MFVDGLIPVNFIQRHRYRLGCSPKHLHGRTRAAMSDAGDVCTPSPDATEIFGNSNWSDAVSSDETARVPNAHVGKVPQGPTSATRVGWPRSTITRVSPRTAATQHPESRHQGVALTQCQTPLARTDGSPCPAPAHTADLTMHCYPHGPRQDSVGQRSRTPKADPAIHLLSHGFTHFHEKS